MLGHLLPYVTVTALHLFSGVSAAAIGTLPEYSNNNVGSGDGVEKRDENDGQQGQDQEGQDEVLGYLDEDTTLEEVTQLMSEIPDEVVEKGMDATESWIRAHRPQLVERDLDDDDDDDDDEMTQEETTQLMAEVPDEVVEQGIDATVEWMKENRHAIAERDLDLEARGTGDVVKCAAYIAWAIGLNANPLIKGFSMASKALKLKKLIDKMGGVKKALSKLTNPKKGKHRKTGGEKGKHRKGKDKRPPSSGSGQKKSYADELQKLAWEVLSIDGVIENCPKIFD